MAKVALLIGVSEYEPGLKPLLAAVNDVDAMREILLNPTIGGFVEPDVTVLKNPERQIMEEEIELLFAGRNKDDLVMFFFSGHGIKDDTGRLYLATRGTRKTPKGELIRSTAVSSNILHESMSRSRSKRQVIILDSCFSGAFAEGMSAKDDGTVDIRAQLGGEGRAVLTSSSSTQYSFEYEGSDLSLYTRFLVDGIKTGEADQDEDEVISIDELHEYVRKKVQEIIPEAKPEIFAIREGFKIQLAKVPHTDPRQKYRKEVMRFIKRGEISLIGRRTLDWKRSELGLAASEANAIEDEILEPSRQKFREKLWTYEQAFTDLLQHHETISEEDRHELQYLQRELELGREDTLTIEVTVTAQIKAFKQKLQEYEQAFAQAMQEAYPLSPFKRSELQQMRVRLELTEVDVTPIESRITDQLTIETKTTPVAKRTAPVAKLTIETKGQAPLNFALERNSISLGSAEDNTLILDDQDVSRHHATLSWRQNCFVIEDLGSYTGTKLNGIKLLPRTPEPLQNQDQIHIGGFLLIFSEFAPGTIITAPPPLPGTLVLGGGGTPLLLVATKQWMQEFPIKQDVVVLGRNPLCDIQIDHPSVSDRHALISHSDDGYEIIDLGSKQGLLQDQQKISQQALQDGDIFKIGEDLTLTFIAVAPVQPSEELTPLNLRDRRTLTFGRDPTNDKVIDHPVVSRFHAKLELLNNEWVIQDLDSSNGTYVDGRQIQGKKVLRPGESIRVGPYQVIFNGDGTLIPLNEAGTN